MKNPYFKLGILIAMLSIGLVISASYWMTDAFGAIDNVPQSIVYLVAMYIVLRLLKRFVFREIQKWDSWYIVGLISIVSAVLLAKPENAYIFHWIIDLGSLFFILPVAFELRQWFKNRNNYSS